MQNQKLQFKVHSVRTLASPYTKENQSLETLYYLLVNMRDLPEGISLKVNPREPNMKTDVAKEIIAAVTEPETDFHINNRGIIISAKSLSFDTSKSEVCIDLGDQDDPSDLEQFGILDGGHTYRAIIENRSGIPSDLEKYVRVEVITNVQNIARLSDARNTSRQVSDAALFNLDGKFGDIQKAIKDTAFADRVAYKDNENKDIHVISLLRLMYAVDVEKYPHNFTAPVQSFSGKAQVFKRYSVAYDTPFYKSLTKQIPTLAMLFDCIERDLPQKYKDYKEAMGIKGRFGAVSGVENVTIDKNGKSTDKMNYTTYTQTPTEYQISSGYIYPIFGAFRALLQYDEGNGEVSWIFDPIEVWNEVGMRLAQNTFDGAKNPQSTGKDVKIWLGNYEIVETQSLRKQLMTKNKK